MGDERDEPDDLPKPFIDQVFEDQSRRPVEPVEAVEPVETVEPVQPAQPVDAREPSAPSGAREHVPADEPGEPAGPASLSPDDAALVDEAMKKSGLIWVTTPDVPAGRAFWHAWVGQTAYVLTGPGEQPDPRWPDDTAVSVLVRSKDNAHRLVTFDGQASRLRPGDDDWEVAATALAAGRLNLHDAASAPSRWAAGDAVLYRLSLTGTLSEGPGAYPDVSHRARPRSTPATTQGAKPWVLHKRGGSGRPLS